VAGASFIRARSTFSPTAASVYAAEDVDIQGQIYTRGDMRQNKFPELRKQLANRTVDKIVLAFKTTCFFA